MQNLTAPPRDAYTEAQIRELLTGQGVRRGFGLDLLDSSNNFVSDLSEQCRGFTVKYVGDAEVRKSLTVNDLTADLAWGRDRVRPFITLSKDGIEARFDMGVFVLSTPESNQGRTPIVRSVEGQDLTHLLDRYIGDTYVIGADGSLTYMSALRQLLTDAGITVPVLLDGTRQDTVIPATMVWGISQDPRWLDVANDLLSAIGYTDIYNDATGSFHASPVAPVAQRPVEWTFDTSDPATDIVAADWTETLDLWSAYNVWRGVASPWPSTPVANDGLYEVANQSDGPSSIDSVGRRPHPLISVNVADQAALVTEVERQKAADQVSEKEVVLKVDPLPIAGHADVVELRHDGTVWKTLVAEWEVVAGGGADVSSQKGSWRLGGVVSGARERTETSATATVTSLAPLRVLLDGATVSSYANQVADTSGAVLALDLGSRVSVTVRNPQPPVVQSVVESTS